MMAKSADSLGKDVPALHCIVQVDLWMHTPLTPAKSADLQALMCQDILLTLPHAAGCPQKPGGRGGCGC